jgi:hypothetical protein
MVATTAIITALITISSMHAVSTTSPAKAMTATPSLNIMQMMRDAKNLPVESYDACACTF